MHARHDAPNPRRSARVTAWLNPFGWFWRHYYGYEFFVSHAQADARAYAAALHRELTVSHHFRCFLDRTEIEAGEGLSPAIQRALARTDVLIVLRTEGAERSSWVAREVELFRPTGRRIIAVDLRDGPSRADGTTVTPLGRALGELLYIPEDNAALGRGPTADTIRTVCRSFEGVRVATRRLWIVAGVAVLLLFATALAVRFGFREREAKESARREAVAARRETANRLAVQAVERLRNAPEESLVLAMEAVRGFRSHGDPLVPDAVAALQKAFLALSRGRRIRPWDPEAPEPQLTDDLRWMMALEPDGGVRVASTGSPRWRSVEFPAGALGPGQEWLAAPARAVWSSGGWTLAVARRWSGTNSSEGARVVVWDRDASGRFGSARVLGDVTEGYTDSVQMAVSPNGGWVAWSDGRDRVWLRDAAARADAVTIRFASARGPFLRFGPDSKRFVVLEPFRIRHWRLMDDTESVAASAGDSTSRADGGLPRAIEQGTLTESLREVVDLTFSEVRDRMAVLTLRGEVVWWDLTVEPPVAHEVPPLFPAYAEYLKIWSLDDDDVTAGLQFGPLGDVLLGSIRERKHGEFGIAAVLNVDTGGVWRTLLQRHTGKAFERVSRSSGGIVGGQVTGREGYRVEDIGQLGVRSAELLMLGQGVATLGFDGTVFLWDLDRPRPLHVTSGASSVAAPIPSGRGTWLATGGSDGRVELWDIDAGELDEGPRFRFGGHDAPVRRLRWSPDQRRVLSTDVYGIGRLWDLDHPFVDTEHFEDSSHDGRWLVTKADREPFLIWDAETHPTLEEPVSAPSLADARTIRFDSESAWAVSMHRGTNAAAPIVLRLWDLTETVPWSVPKAECVWVDDAPEPGVVPRDTVPGIQVASRDGGVWVFLRTWGHGTNRLGWVNLLDPEPRVREVGAIDSRSVTVHPSRDLRWLAIESAPSPDGSPGSYRLRALTARPDPEREIHLSRPTQMTSYSPEFGPDGRWLARRLAWRTFEFFDLDPATTTGPLEPVGRCEDCSVALGHGRPPLWVDEKGNLWGVASEPGVGRGRVPLLLGRRLTSVAWDDAGAWLGLGDTTGRVYALPLARGLPLSDLRDRLESGLGQALLPGPVRRIAPMEVGWVALFPGPGWIAAVDEGETLRLWPRRPGGDWDVPLVLDKADLLIERAHEIAMAPDGRRVRIGRPGEPRVLPLDPGVLLKAAEGLLSGRVRTVGDIGDPTREVQDPPP